MELREAHSPATLASSGLRVRNTWSGMPFSTIALADEVIVLEGGRVTARGDHDELLERSDLYREIVEKDMPDQVFLTRKPLEAGVARL